jgi:ribonuclease HI
MTEPHALLLVNAPVPCDLRAVPWVQAILRGTKVYARVDAGGSFVAENGRVEIRYKPNDGRRYHARADNLNVVSGEILPDETCGPADGVDAGKTAGKGGATAGGGPTAARAKRSTKAAAEHDASSSHDHASHEHGAHHGGAAAIHVYADGACSGNPGPAGLGVVVLDSESRVEISEYIGQGTNNIAELTAILRALGETADSERPLVIHTDSSYSIGVLQKGWKAKANQELVAELREHLKGRKGVRLVYVPGHAGVKWNERADALARDAVVTRKSARKVVRAASSTL